MSWVKELARPDIVALKAYDHAAWEPSLERLHANELPWRPRGDESIAGLTIVIPSRSRELWSRRLRRCMGVPHQSVSRGTRKRPRPFDPPHALLLSRRP